MEVVIFTKKCPSANIEVGYFRCWNEKNLEIPIKTAIFRPKIPNEHRVAL